MKQLLRYIFPTSPAAFGFQRVREHETGLVMRIAEDRLSISHFADRLFRRSVAVLLLLVIYIDPASVPT